MGLAKTGFTKDTPLHYLIDAGVVYLNLKFSGGEFTGTLAGATSGGVTVSVENTYRDIETDGTSHTRVKGQKVLESAVATATTNMKEITAETIKRSLNGKLKTGSTPTIAPEGYKVVTSKRFVDDDDYIDNIAIVGRMSGSKQPIIAILDNVIVTNGIEMAMEDNNEAVIEQIYEAHATHDQLEKEEFPWRFLFPPINGAESGTDNGDDEEEDGDEE